MVFQLLAAAVFAATGFVMLSALWKRGGRVPKFCLVGVACAVLMQACGLCLSTFTEEGVVFGFGQAVSASLLYSVVVLAIRALFGRIGPVFGITSVAAGAAALMPLVFPGEPVSAPEVWTPFFILHLSLGLLTYGLLAVAVVQAVLMELQKRRFRSLEDPIPETGVLSTLPPILMMEKIFFYILATCFAALSMLLVTGAVTTHDVYGVYFHLDHKTFLTWLSWILCGGLLLGRRMFGWRGKKATFCFWVFCCVFVLSYLVYTFVHEFLN